MHPILAKPTRILLYLAGWLPILALLAYLLSSTGGAPWLRSVALLAPACLLFAFICLSPWPICRVRPLHVADIAILATTWTAAAAAASALFTGAAWMTARLLTPPLANPGMLFAVGILLYLLSAGLHYTALAAAESREAQQRAAEARSLARDAELHALRMQINPHFLFNSLHSIAALTTQDAARARDMCIRLSDFLRSTLGLGNREAIPLREELALARSYLEVEQVRFGPRLQFTENIHDDCRECAVPVLILQPLIENAIKHGIAGLLEGGPIKLSIDRDATSVHLTLENAFDPDASSPARLGVGLTQVRRRLELRYGSAATMHAAAEGATYRVALSFPCTKETA